MKHLFFVLILLAGCVVGCAHRSNTRAEFLGIIERPEVPLNATAGAPSDSDDVVQVSFSFNADKEQRVPGNLFKTKGSQSRRPVVIVLHGTGGSRNSVTSLCRKLATNGFVAVAIDGRYHGERTRLGRGSDEYQEAIVAAWRGSGEHPFFYDTVWDVMRLVDYLETRDDVDPSRIGLIGISKGGIETYLTAAVDSRIAVAVPCIGVQSFGWALENDAWQSRLGTIPKAFDTIARDAGIENPDAAFARRFYDRVAPGIYDRFDGPDMLPLIAPRPLLVINGDSDPRTPLAGLRLCIEAAEEAYRSAGAEDRLLVRIQENTGHRVQPEAEREAIEWFVRWLRP